MPSDDRPAPQRSSRPLAIRLAGPIRWLHTYLSMFGLVAVLFFSLTGITLNHPGWFYDGVATDVEAEGRVDPALLRGEVDRLAIVERLRAEHALRGALASFTEDEDECVVTFKGPGYSADAFIRRPEGTYRLAEHRHGLVAVLAQSPFLTDAPTRAATRGRSGRRWSTSRPRSRGWPRRRACSCCSTSSAGGPWGSRRRWPGRSRWRRRSSSGSCEAGGAQRPGSAAGFTSFRPSR